MYVLNVLHDAERPYYKSRHAGTRQMHRVQIVLTQPAFIHNACVFSALLLANKSNSHPQDPFVGIRLSRVICNRLTLGFHHHHVRSLQGSNVRRDGTSRSRPRTRCTRFASTQPLLVRGDRQLSTLRCLRLGYQPCAQYLLGPGRTSLKPLTGLSGLTLLLMYLSAQQLGAGFPGA